MYGTEKENKLADKKEFLKWKKIILFLKTLQMK
ncbi:hypothetical protein CYOC110262_11205 [Cytobacillus oceanisediminis]